MEFLGNIFTNFIFETLLVQEAMVKSYSHQQQPSAGFWVATNEKKLFER